MTHAGGRATSGSPTTPAGRPRRRRPGRRRGRAGPRSSSTQVEYSLLERGVEREVLPAALELGLGVLPWSPLGRGVLTGKYRSGTPADSRGGLAALRRLRRPVPDAGRGPDRRRGGHRGRRARRSRRWRSRWPGCATGPASSRRSSAPARRPSSPVRWPPRRSRCRTRSGRALDEVSAPGRRLPRARQGPALTDGPRRRRPAARARGPGRAHRRAARGRAGRRARGSSQGGGRRRWRPRRGRLGGARRARRRRGLPSPTRCSAWPPRTGSRWCSGDVPDGADVVAVPDVHRLAAGRAGRRAAGRTGRRARRAQRRPRRAARRRPRRRPDRPARLGPAAGARPASVRHLDRAGRARRGAARR